MSAPVIVTFEACKLLELQRLERLQLSKPSTDAPIKKGGNLLWRGVDFARPAPKKGAGLSVDHDRVVAKVLEILDDFLIRPFARQKLTCDFGLCLHVGLREDAQLDIDIVLLPLPGQLLLIEILHPLQYSDKAVPDERCPGDHVVVFGKCYIRNLMKVSSLIGKRVGHDVAEEILSADVASVELLGAAMGFKPREIRWSNS